VPKADLTPPTPETCIGYGCVVVPSLNEYQGFFINDTPDLRSQINRTVGLAVMTGQHPIGALQAVIVDRALNRDWTRVGVTALALANLTKVNFFWIKAEREPEGTRTEMFPLNATTVEEARAEIDAIPEVIELKRRLVESLRQPKQ